MIKAKKIDDNTTLYVHEKTNEPIAVAKSKSDPWNRRNKNYSISWHPVTKQLYPATESFTHMNFDRETSANDVKNRIEHRYESLLNSSDNPDPLKTSKTDGLVKKKYSTSTGDHEEEFHHFFVHEPENNHVIASMFIKKHLLDTVRPGTSSFNNDQHSAFVEYLGEKPNEGQEAIARKKFGGNNPVAHLNRIKYWLENKTKEPRFVGLYRGHNTSVFRTNLAPEVAAKEYAAHLQSTTSQLKAATPEQITPTMIRLKVPATGRYDTAVHHIIDSSEPNRVHHHTVKVPEVNSYDTKPLNEVID